MGSDKLCQYGVGVVGYSDMPKTSYRGQRCYLLSVVAQSRILSLEEWRKVASNRPYFPFSGHVTRDFQIFQL